LLIAVIAYEGFTDVDLFLPFGFFHRVKVPYGAGYTGAWTVRLLSDQPRLTSYSGVSIEAQGTLAEAVAADAVFVVSGDGSRAKLADPAFMSALQFAPSRQIIGAIDSGALILAGLGLLDGLSATTYPPVMPELEAMGVRTEMRALCTAMLQPAAVASPHSTGAPGWWSASWTRSRLRRFGRLLVQTAEERHCLTGQQSRSPR
jgi:putative intracellular protease/amidase